MNSQNHLWLYPEPVPDNVKTSLESFSLPFQSVLFNRGFNSSEEAIDFLLPKEPDWRGKLNLLHVDKSCQLISSAVQHQYPIGIFGDYDADGITSTALLTLALREIHQSVIPVIPNRLIDGYGLNTRIIDEFHDQGVKLIITVDNGIRSFSETAYAKELGIDVIITDHHNPASTLPSCSAVINPKLPDDPYPNKHLAGVGVAYKLVTGLAEIYPTIDPDNYLDLVAIGTISDIVPLLGENRYLVKMGLKQINLLPRQSLHSLIGVCGISGKSITSSDVSYQVAPRLNSSGRLTDTDHEVPLKLLLNSDPIDCGRYAQILDNHNQARKSISKDLQDMIETQILDFDTLPSILIALDEKVDPGVAGIAAGHLTRKFYRPSVVGRIGPDTTTASCRSIPEFSMIASLENIRNLFQQFGGHKLAAGFTIENKNLELLRQELSDQADQVLSEIDLIPKHEIDAVVKLSDLDNSLYKELSKLEPTGAQNPKPIFAAHNLFAGHSASVGSDGDHLKIRVSDGKFSINGIGFGLGYLSANLPDRFNIIFHFTENQYMGRKEFQLQILDLVAL